MVMPVIAGSIYPQFFWNLSCNVGLMSPNRIEDVQLVQLGYAVMADKPNEKPALRAMFKLVIPGAAYSANEADPLTKAILAHQADRGSTQDGHVSVISNLKTAHYGAEKSFMLVGLVNSIMKSQPDQFPRIDLHPKCPSALRATVKYFLVR